MHQLIGLHCSNTLVLSVICVLLLMLLRVNGNNQSAQTNETLLLDAYPTWESFATRFIPIAFYVDRYVTLVYYAVGFPGNMISFVVWTSRRVYKGNSAAMYLAAVSLNDIVVLIFALVRDLIRSWEVKIYLTPGACEVKNTLTPAVQYASPLFVLGFTVERWLAICRPFAIDRICSIRRAIYFCVLISIGTILICSGNAYIFFTEEYFCDKRTPGSTLVSIYLSFLELVFSGAVPLLVLIFNCMVIREMARVHRANRQLALISGQFTTHPRDKAINRGQQLLTGWFLLCLRKCLLCSHKTHLKDNEQMRTCQHSKSGLLLGAESKEYQTTILPNREDSSVVNPNANDQNGVQRKEFPERKSQARLSHSKGNPSFRSTTMMLLIVSFYMIVTTLLGGLIYLLHQTNDQPNMKVTETELQKDPQWNRYLTIMTIKAFGDEIALSYYAFGFIIYYATGQAFRHQVHFLLRRLLTRCGFHCDAIMQLGVSEDFEFLSNKRRTTRLNAKGLDLGCISAPTEEHISQSANPVRQQSSASYANSLRHVTTPDPTIAQNLCRQVHGKNGDTPVNKRNSHLSSFQPTVQNEKPTLHHMDSFGDPTGSN